MAYCLRVKGNENWGQLGQVIFSMIKICKNKYGMSRKIIIIVYTVQLSFHFMPQPFKFTY